MSEIKAEYLNAFVLSTQKLLQDMCLASNVNIGKPLVKETEASNDAALISVGLIGDITGDVVLSFPNVMALDIITKMTMMPIDEINEIGISAISELGNMIMGNAATILSGHNMSVDITTPKYYQGETPGKSCETNICVPLFCDNSNCLEVNLALSVA